MEKNFWDVLLGCAVVVLLYAGLVIAVSILAFPLQMAFPWMNDYAVRLICSLLIAGVIYMALKKIL